jgi:AcrR family transcriptional regulator
VVLTSRASHPSDAWALLLRHQVNATNFRVVASSHTKIAPRKQKRAYHHGNLRDALIDVAIELITAGGVQSFSLAEACRQLDVTVAAPYRHFADRNALLTAVAIRATEKLSDALSAVHAETDDPAERLVGVSRRYVEFAATEPALFETMFANEVFLGGNPELASTVRPTVEAFVGPARMLPGATAELAGRVVLASAAAAHGFASLLRAGSFSGNSNDMHTASEGAASATRAIIAGRAVLATAPEQPEIILAGIGLQGWVGSYLATEDDTPAAEVRSSS